MTRHKHCEVIKAWADGEEIQVRHDAGEMWTDVVSDSPSFSPTFEYRIKPRTVKREGWVNIATYGTTTRYPQRIVYESREQAEKDKCDDTVGTAKIEWEETE